MSLGRILAVGGACLSAVAAKVPTLDENNLRDRWRPAANPDWKTVWGEPRLLDGSVARPGRGTDTSLHYGDVKLFGSSAWVDFAYPFQWERDWMAIEFGTWARSVWWLGPVAALSYVCILWISVQIMKHCEAFDLKGPLAVWNFVLAVFSWLGAFRTVPHLFHMISETSVDFSICRAAFNSCGHGPVGFWIAAFVMSKYAELIDTVFLVLRKKPIGFLHWYHHCTVLLYCWHAYLLEVPTGLYFMALNYSVHALMYLYYFLAAVQTKPPKWGRFVTIMQLSQMVLGIAVTLRHLHLLLSGKLANCDGYTPNLIGALTMYASYFLLFAQFFVQRYCMKRKGGSSKNGKVNADAKGLKKE